jgi:hypothetical protein
MEYRGERNQSRALMDDDPTDEKVHELMVEYKINFEFLAAFMLIVNAGSKHGIFVRVTSISPFDLSLGHVYWWLIKFIFIFGVADK